MTEAPLHFVKQIQDALLEAKAFPMSGLPPAFPWEAFSERIGALLQAAEVTVSLRKTQRLSGDAMASGFGAGFIAIALELTPLSGQAFWLMGKEDIAKLATLALYPTNGGKGFSSSKFQEGFYYFLATQVLQAVDELQAFKDLSPKMGKFSSLPFEEEALCIDVEIRHPKAALWGRLICPASFHQAFEAYFSTEQPPPLTSALAQQLDVSLRVEVGQTSLSSSQWEQVSVGDLVLLDRCTFDPDSHKGTVTLVLEKTPLLRARIKDNGIKIVDYAFYHEEQSQLDVDMPQEEENVQEPSESGEGNDENHLWSARNNGEEKDVPSQEIPLVLTVEAARLSINLGTLLQLSPGSVLELPVKPEQGVDVTMDGKLIAKAELIKLGEMIGFKILQMGE